MSLLRRILDRMGKPFEKGCRLARLYPVWEAGDTFLYTPATVTSGASHVRDSADLKRVMITVVVALSPCMLMAMYNTGYQAHLAIEAGAAPLDNWRTAAMQWMGLPFSPHHVWACLVHGALYFLPIYFVTVVAGGLCEVLFAVVRRHEINEGFLVTSALFPLTLPATIPLWQVALGIMFGVVIGKEVFGGVGRNIWNPALVSRAFLYFAYPAQITGETMWIAAKTGAAPDAYSGATWLAVMREQGPQTVAQGLSGMQPGVGWWDAFVGFIPGSLGETSALLCLVGAIILIVTKVGSWRIMAGGLIGSAAVAMLVSALGLRADTIGSVPFYWHWVIGGFAFAIVFMATDPVTAPFTGRGQLVYGLIIGALGILIRDFNPAFPESWMLTILFMNMFSPLIDHFVLQANVKRRMARYAAQ